MLPKIQVRIGVVKHTRTRLKRYYRRKNITLIATLCNSFYKILRCTPAAEELQNGKSRSLITSRDRRKYLCSWKTKKLRLARNRNGAGSDRPVRLDRVEVISVSRIIRAEDRAKSKVGRQRARRPSLIIGQSFIMCGINIHVCINIYFV